MQSAKYFFNYVIRDLEIAMDNPLENVKMQAVQYDPEVISARNLNYSFRVSLRRMALELKDRKEPIK